MESSTEILRKLLDERGVEYRIECKQTRATFESFNRFIVLNERGGLRGAIDVYLDGACNCTWQFDGLTPEQAIAATLGTPERTCRIEERYIDWYCDACFEMVGTCDTTSELFIDGNAIKLWNFCPNCGARVERWE